MSSILELEQLACAFDVKHPVLTDISFLIEEGSFTVLSGRNGTGKSLLLRCIKGLVQPIGGSIRIDGTDFTRRAKERNRRIGLVFQEADTQVVGQTVERDILFGLENMGVERSERVCRMESVAEQLALTPLLKQRPRALSGGERRRLAIAGVLAMQPHMLFLDEPFANLDYLGIVTVLESLVSLHAQGTTIVVATHEIEKLLAHADTMIVLEQGTVAAHGAPGEILPVVGRYGMRQPRMGGEPVPVEELSWLR